jgi:hypothetical protein
MESGDSIRAHNANYVNVKTSQRTVLDHEWLTDEGNDIEGGDRSTSVLSWHDPEVKKTNFSLYLIN